MKKEPEIRRYYKKTLKDIKESRTTNGNPIPLQIVARTLEWVLQNKK